MKLRAVSLLLGVLLLVGSVGGQKDASPGRAGAAGPIRHVIIVSVDGLMPASYLRPDAHGLKVPTLREMVRGGAWSEGARSVFPSVTYPAHTTMATGTSPRTHGIVTNQAWDPLEKNRDGWRWYAEDIRAPTLWDAARAAGLRTALVWWPATVGARGTVVVPEIWRASTPDDTKLARALATPGVLGAVEKRFPNFRAGFTPPEVKNESATDIAVHALETVRPHLLMLHLLEVDHWEHHGGLFSAPARGAMEDADRQIARLIAAAKKAGIWEQTALVVVSDHGFAPIAQRVRPGVLLREKGLLELDELNRIRDWKAVVLAGAGHAYLYVNDEKDTATQQTLLETFLPLAGKPGSGVGRVYRQEEIRAKGGDPTAFLALEGAEGFGITDGYTGEYISASSVVATHGFDPDRADMQASLLIYGPPIAPGKIEGARLVDLGPSVAGWLGLKLPKAEGNRLPVRLRKTRPHN